MTARGGGAARWNRETQRWEDGAPPPAAYTGPMPPRPHFRPSAGAAPGAPVPAQDTGPDPAPRPVPQAGPDDGFLLVPEPPDAAPGPARRTVALAAGAAVAVIAAGLGGGYLLWRDQGADPAAAPARTSAKPTPSSPSTASTGPAASTAPPVSSGPPEGYRTVHDEEGFTLAVPGGWEREKRKNGVFYLSPDGRGLLQVFQNTDSSGTPRESLENTSKELSHSALNPGYEELALGPLPGPAPDAAPDAFQLVYAYDSKDVGERVRVVDCAFTASDGRQFAVLVRGTEAEWPQQEQIQRIALRSFAPGTAG
ncbi:hypothetical protein ACWC2K_08710 [Streptomyces chattanoogensis]|uniref:hypothetical protein n=1 Tax=Streptomyces chattanoogensis TaxID=66876 RepID=UPI0036A43238